MDGQVLGTAQDKDKEKALDKAAKMTLHLFDPTGKSAQIDGKPLTLNQNELAAAPVALPPRPMMGGPPPPMAYPGMPPRPMGMPPGGGYFMPPPGMPGMPPRPPFPGMPPGMPPPPMPGAGMPPFQGGMPPRPPPGLPPGAMGAPPPPFPMPSPSAGAPPQSFSAPAPAPVVDENPGLQFKEEMMSMEERRAELHKYRFKASQGNSGPNVEQKVASLDQSIAQRLAAFQNQNAGQ